MGYSYDGSRAVEIMDSTGRLAPNIYRELELNKEQADRLINIISAPSAYGGGVAACFEPHLGFVFYRSGKPVIYMSICLDCNYLIASIPLAGAEDGFSEEGKLKIINLQKELQLEQPGMRL